MDIPTKGPATAGRPNPIPLKYQKFVDKEIKLPEAAGYISQSLSPQAAPITKVLKKSDPNQPNKLLFWMVLDYRKLHKAINSVHNSDRIVSYYPLPNISDLLARLGNCRILSSLDLHSRYHHTGIKPEARPKITFATMSGKWYWNIMPFGICSLPIIFSYLRSEVLKDLDFCFTYLDDILIYSPSWEEHINHLSLIFGRLKGANLKIELSQCQFSSKSYTI